MAGTGWISFLWDRTESIRHRRQVAQQYAATQCKQADEKRCEALNTSVRSVAADEDAVDVAVWQLWLNMVGIGGLAATVVYARRAWVAASDSAVAARKALRHTEDTSAAQLRPYVYFTRDVSDPVPIAHHDGKAYLVLQNFGQTPARNVRIRRGLLPINRPIGAAIVPLTEGEEDVMDIAPGQGKDLYFQMSDLTKEQFDAFTGPLPYVLLIRMQAEYEYEPGKLDSHEITFVLSEAAVRHGHLPLLGHSERTKDAE